MEDWAVELCRFGPVGSGQRDADLVHHLGQQTLVCLGFPDARTYVRSCQSAQLPDLS